MRKQRETLADTSRRLRPEGTSPMERFRPLKKPKGCRRSEISKEALNNIFRENYLKTSCQIMNKI
jgi:hypothetical protein